MDNEKIEILANHYQKTYELTLMMWKQRNRIFLILLGVIGLGTLLTFRSTETNSIFLDWVSNVLGISNQKERVSELRNSFPFGLLQGIFLMVVFYLMVNLCHRNTYVLKNYSYLSHLEKEIRVHIGLTELDVSFTRESEFYWAKRDYLQAVIKWVYVIFLGLLLLAFLGGRIWEDFTTNKILAAVDILISIPILLFYFEYTRSTIKSDSKEEMMKSNRVSGKPFNLEEVKVEKE